MLHSKLGQRTSNGGIPPFTILVKYINWIFNIVVKIVLILFYSFIILLQYLILESYHVKEFVSLDDLRVFLMLLEKLTLISLIY